VKKKKTFRFLVPLSCVMAKQDPDWAGFRAWLHSVVVVTFDLELGQVIERTFPCRESGQQQQQANTDELSEQDRTNICYLAFPDSNSGIMGDIQFHFRIRKAEAFIYKLTPVQILLVQEFVNTVPIHTF
jgi:hypothetical protein